VKNRLVIPTAMMLALGGSFALQPNSALAQAANPPAPADQATQAQPQPGQPAQTPRPRRSFTSHVEGRIAYMKAELKITSAQQAAFNKVAQAMRDNAAEREKNFADMRANRGQHQSAVDRLENGQKLAQLRAHADQRYLAAFKPLYDSLSADQKQAADDMFAPHRSGFGRRHA